MKCLVTGGAGFIGNTLIKRLVNEGHEVKALIHKTKPKKYESKAEYVSGDITDLNSIKPLVKDIEVVFHCAALVKDYGPRDIFYKVNLEGTKNLVKACERNSLKKFVFLSHIIRFKSEKNISYYSKTKALAEEYLLDKYEREGFPVVIIRPGNVYGPGSTTWVLRLLNAIKKDRIALIDNGKGVFFHTYIDNLTDALIATMKEPKAIGETIEITDGDSSITWNRYLNDLAQLVGKKSIKKNLSKRSALMIGKTMVLLHKIFRIEPWITPTAAHFFTNDKTGSLEKAERILGFKPKIDYDEGMKRIQKWLQDENII